MTEKKTVVQEDYFKLQWIRDAALSPCGKKAVFAKMRSEEKDGKMKDFSALYMLDVETGDSFQFTSEKTGGGNVAWSPDGKQIAFLSAKEGAPQVFIMAVDGGEARLLTEMKQGVGGGPLWSPDGKFIAFTAGPALDAPPDYSKPYRVTRNVYRADGMGYVDPLVQDVYMIEVASGKVKQLTNDDFSYILQEWSPDGQELAALKMADPNSHSMNMQLVLVSTKAKVQDLLPNWGNFASAGWLPDGKHLYFSGSESGKPIGSKSDLYIIRRHGSEPECRTAGLKYGIGGGLQPDRPVMAAGKSKVSKDGKFLYTGLHIGGTLPYYKIALTGEESWEPVLEGDRSIRVIGMVEDETILFESATLLEPGDLYRYDLKKKTETRLTEVNKEIVDGWLLPTLEHLWFKGSDGADVEGWLLKPAVGEAPYPMVLYIHGGPHSAWGHMFSFDFQMLAGAGYAVLFINHRASTGYGDEFSTAIKGDWGNLDYKDLMAGVDHVIEKGWVDEDRMGCCGISGGGNLSCWIVGQTDRFKAAVPENPVANWLSFYGVSDIGVDFGVEELGGHPHEIREIYKKCSPTTYAHKCTTPTLLVQGEHDFRCPAEQSEQFYSILKSNGCIAEMVRLPNSSHAASIGGDPNIRKYQNEVLLDWMDRYVLGKTPA